MGPNAVRAGRVVRINHAIEDESSDSRLIAPHISQALLGLSDTRRQRTARLLSLADRERRCSFAELQRAEIELASLAARAEAVERESISAMRNRQAPARDILALRAGQARHAAQLAANAEHVRACATRWEHARQIYARRTRQCRETNRKHECLRMWLERLEEVSQR